MSSSFDNYVANERGYKMWLNYNNDKIVCCLPVLPEKIKITAKGINTSASIDKLGEVLHKGNREALKISFSSYFPALYGSYCTCLKREFLHPKVWHDYLIAHLQAAQPMHFVLTGSPLRVNIYAIITQYTPEEQGGDVGTIYYTLELKEFRTPAIRKYTKNLTTQVVKATTTQQRVDNTVTEQSYTIKQGDCLWNLAKQFYGSGVQYTKLLNANQAVLDRDAQKYGYSNSRNGNLIFPGTVITIP